MAPCAGHLVIHNDGTPLYCTADLTDTRCTNHAPERHTTILHCWSVMPHGQCGYCRSAAASAGRDRGHLGAKSA